MRNAYLHITMLLLAIANSCLASYATSSSPDATMSLSKAQLTVKNIDLATNDAGSIELKTDNKHIQKAAIQVIDGDTLYLVWLKDVYIFPPMKFKNKKQERFYWRTVRDVKLTLPYAKLIAQEMERTADVMSQMNNKQQKKFWKQYEKTLMQQYKVDLSKWTAGQGQMLMKLVDRETGKTSYEVIQMYRGTFIANLWQGVAKLVGNNLKEEYDGDDKDKITERIILLVEAGQL